MSMFDSWRLCASLLFAVFLLNSKVSCAEEDKRSLFAMRGSPSKVHDLFVQHYPGGKEAFLEAVRERSDWSPLQLFEYSRSDTWSKKWTPFDAMGPVIQCPAQIFESFGKGDGEKHICGSMKDDDCVVISIGSHNEWDFELALIAKYPHCKVHTFDCYVRAMVPASIRSQVTFHPVCAGPQDKVDGGKQFMSWGSIVKKIGLQKPPTAMKMDIEGFEWTVIPAIIKSNVMVPESFSFELHYDTSIQEVPWKGRLKSSPEIGLFMELLYSLGYALVDRHDNVRCISCSEIVTAKVLLNSRFPHHAGTELQSNFAGNATAAKALNVDPFPTFPH